MFVVLSVREGYNAWRDSLKPSELLSKMCRENGLDAPRFSPGKISVADKVFHGKTLYMHEGKADRRFWVCVHLEPSADLL